MRRTRVRSPEEDEIRVLGLLVAAGAATRSKNCRQTDDARSVSRSVTAVDIVVAEGDARELLRQEIQLVRRF